MKPLATEIASDRSQRIVSDYATAVRRISMGKPLPTSPAHPGPTGTSSVLQPDLASEELLRSNGIEWHSRLDAAFRRAHELGVVTNIVVHGSYGDFTHTRFSDLEVSVVLSQKAVSQRPAARQLSKWVIHDLNPLILDIDPLQHHGAFFLWPGLLGSYSEAILPLSAYQKCWAISGGAVVFHVEDDPEAIARINRNRLRQTLISLLDYKDKFFKLGPSLYANKRLLSNFFMVPVYFYQSAGSLISKRDALERVATGEFPSEFCVALQLATTLRERWPGHSRLLSHLRRRLVRTAIPQGRLDLLLSAIWRDAEIEQIVQDEFIPSMVLGCKEILDVVTCANKTC